MKVGDLIETLQEFNPESDVRIASLGYRSRFQYGVDDVDEVRLGDEDDVPVDEEGNTVVFLLEGTQIGYMPSGVTAELGWD